MRAASERFRCWHQFTNFILSFSASSFFSANGICLSSMRAAFCCFFGTLSSTLRILWFQHRCSADSGKTLRNAPQIPKCPSPTTSLGQFMPRAFRSRRNSDQASVDSLCPGTTDRISFEPSLLAPIATSRAAYLFPGPLSRTRRQPTDTLCRTAADVVSIPPTQVATLLSIGLPCWLTGVPHPRASHAAPGRSLLLRDHGGRVLELHRRLFACA